MTRRDLPLLAALSGLTLLAAAASLTWGATPIPAGRILAAVMGAGAHDDMVVVWSIRFPRALAAWLTGASLGLCGAAMQGLLRNPLAEPGVLGVSATASLFATLTIFLGIAAVWPWAVAFGAIAGALVATAVLSVLASRIGSMVALILVGVGISSFSGALMSLALDLAPHPFTLSDLVSWMLGSVANRSLEDVALSAPFIAVGAVLVWSARHGLSALTLGEEAARAVGLDLARTRVALVAGTGLAVGGSVALAGAIGFVGLVAAHCVRPFVGHDPARTLLPAGLLGGLMLVVADALARLAPTANELKLGVVAALVGAPVFVWIAASRRASWGRAGD